MKSRLRGIDGTLSRPKPYPSMTESRVQWLGRIPAHWKILPNRGVYREIKERDRPAETMLSVTIKQGVIHQETLLSTSGKKDSSNLDRTAYKLVRPGDIVYNKMRAWQGAIAASEYRGIVSPAYVVLRPSDEIVPRYLHYLLRIPAFASEAERWSYGITSDMWSLRPERFKLISGCVPPAAEQRAIVRFLDHADRRIGCYIRAKERLIELLEDQKQSITHQAVTGQIDVRAGQPYLVYKDSGVEWLGEVPGHWEVARLHRCVRAFGGMTPSMQTAANWGGGIPWVTPKDMKQDAIANSEMRITQAALDSTSLRLVDSGAALMVVRGMILAKCVPVAWTTVPVTINQDMKALIPVSGVDGQFLTRALRSAQEALLSFVEVAGHGTRRLPTERWRSLRVAIPPTSEQKPIVAFVGRSTKVADSAIEASKRLITLLSEYRTRLIADVVTGKLDVREAAAALPDVDPLGADYNDEKFEGYAEVAVATAHPHP